MDILCDDILLRLITRNKQLGFTNMRHYDILKNIMLRGAYQYSYVSSLINDRLFEYIVVCVNATLSADHTKLIYASKNKLTPIILVYEVYCHIDVSLLNIYVVMGPFGMFDNKVMPHTRYVIINNDKHYDGISYNGISYPVNILLYVGRPQDLPTLIDTHNKRAYRYESQGLYKTDILHEYYVIKYIQDMEHDFVATKTKYLVRVDNIAPLYVDSYKLTLGNTKAKYSSCNNGNVFISSEYEKDHEQCKAIINKHDMKHVSHLWITYTDDEGFKNIFNELALVLGHMKMIGVRIPYVINNHHDLLLSVRNFFKRLTYDKASVEVCDEYNQYMKLTLTNNRADLYMDHQVINTQISTIFDTYDLQSYTCNLSLDVRDTELENIYNDISRCNIASVKIDLFTYANTDIGIFHKATKAIRIFKGVSHNPSDEYHYFFGNVHRLTSLLSLQMNINNINTLSLYGTNISYLSLVAAYDNIVQINISHLPKYLRVLTIGFKYPMTRCIRSIIECLDFVIANVPLHVSIQVGIHDSNINIHEIMKHVRHNLRYIRMS